MPESAELVLSVPPGVASARALQDQASVALHDLEEESRHDLAAARRGFLGRARVLPQNPFTRPAPGEPRRQLSPRVAARDKWKRIETLSILVGFLRAYRAAWAAMRSGVRDTILPAGTYLLRVQHGVRCAAPG